MKTFFHRIRHSFILIFLVFLVACSHPIKEDPYKPFAKYSAKQLYSKAKSSMKSSDFDKAVKELQALAGLYPYGVYAKLALKDLIYAYYEKGDDASVLLTSDRYLQLYPRSRDAAYAYYMKGLSSFSKGQSWLQRRLHISPADRDPSRLQAAYRSFSTVLRDYPRSQYAPDSARRIAYIRNLLAAHVLKVARHYYAIHAYVASANRAEEVISRYSSSTSVPAALVLLEKSHAKLGLKRSADSIHQILVKNKARLTLPQPQHQKR